MSNKFRKYSSRYFTPAVIQVQELIDDGAVDPDFLARICLNYISEDDIKDILQEFIDDGLLNPTSVARMCVKYMPADEKNELMDILHREKEGSMTFRDLLEQLKTLDSDQLDCTLASNVAMREFFRDLYHSVVVSGNDWIISKDWIVPKTKK